MKACCARAPCRADSGRFTRYGRALHRREASLLSRAAVERRASCGFQEPAGFGVARATAPLRSLPLGSRRSMRAHYAHAPCRVGSDQAMRRESAPHRREASFLWCAAVMRRARCSLQELAGFRAARATAPLRSLRLGRRRSTRACCACVPCRASSGRFAHRERALHRREATLFRRTAAVRRASCGLQELAGFRAARATAPLRSLPLGRRRSTRACFARAPCRASSGRIAHRERTLHQREATLFRRTAALRRASCGLQESAGFRVARATAPLRSLPLGRGRSTRGSCARAPCRTGSGRFMNNKRALLRQEASLLPHPAAVQCASCGLQEPACFHVARATAPLRWLPLGRRRSTRACCAYAPACAARGRLMYCERAMHRR